MAKGKKIFHLENKIKSGKGKHKYYTSLTQLVRYNEITKSLVTIRRHDFTEGPFETFEHIIHKGEIVDKTMTPRKKVSQPLK